MKVTLVNYTPNAVDLLLMTKNTRLKNDEIVNDWPKERKMEELAYMRDTIKSSWEFVDYVFMIEEVSRAFTHQLVRTRTASFAQESQRTVDVSDAGFHSPDFEQKEHQGYYDMSITNSIDDYDTMVKGGIQIQDARGVLPTAIHTNIFMKANLRTMAQMAETRLCTRAQGEYQDVFRAMRDAIIEVHPWAEDFINVYCVNTGVCCFPRYTECPMQKHTVKIDALSIAKGNLKREFNRTRHEATPVAKNGKTM